MYGPISGLYFQGQQHHGLREVTDAIGSHIMPRRPARDSHAVSGGREMPTISFPALETQLGQGYQGGHDGAAELPAELAPLFKGYNTDNYGFAGKRPGKSTIHWLA